MPSAASRSSSSLATGEDTTSVMTSGVGCQSSTSSLSAPGGGKFSMPSTAFLTSSSTRSALANEAISTSMRLNPWEAVPTTRSTPDKPTRASSRRRLMSFSTSLGDEPGERTVTVTVRVS